MKHYPVEVTDWLIDLLAGRKVPNLCLMGTRCSGKTFFGRLLCQYVNLLDVNTSYSNERFNFKSYVDNSFVPLKPGITVYWLGYENIFRQTNSGPRTFNIVKKIVPTGGIVLTDDIDLTVRDPKGLGLNAMCVDLPVVTDFDNESKNLFDFCKWY